MSSDAAGQPIAISPVHYARNGDIHLAWRTRGDADIDLVVLGGLTSNLENVDEDPYLREVLDGLAGFARVVEFDHRGTGLSDRMRSSRLPSFEERAADLLAVLDAAGVRRALVSAFGDGGPPACFFAATHPDRTLALALCNTRPRLAWAPDYPWGRTEEQFEEILRDVEQNWGTIEFARRFIERSGPSRAHDEAFIEREAAAARRSGGPGDALQLFRMHFESDVRDLLPAIHVPTLVVSRAVLAEESADMADRIPGARHVVIPGVDRMVRAGDVQPFIAAVREFAREVREEEAALDRVLATLLVTDLVGSTRRAAELGDRAWSQLLDRHHAAVRAQLARFRGNEVDTAGDGFLATFDGPARAIRCAGAIRRVLGDLGLDVRIGLHTGEIETSGGRPRGVAVHVASRIAALAESSEILVSSTVKDLVAGAGLVFVDRGEHELRGAPEPWRLFAVADAATPAAQRGVG